MAQVNVRIAGRIYRMACGDGEEGHLTGLAARLDDKIVELRGAFGEIGDGRITVMAALTIADQLAEAERRIAALEAENDGCAAESRLRGPDGGAGRDRGGGARRGRGPHRSPRAGASTPPRPR